MRLMWTFVVLGLAVPSLAVGQSMGEAARQEAERREKNKKSGVKAKAYGDEDLKSAHPPSQGTYNNGSGEATSPSASPSPEAPAAGSAEVPDESARRAQQEAEWRKRVAEATARRDKAKAFYDKISKMSLAPGEWFEDEKGRVVVKD